MRGLRLIVLLAAGTWPSAGLALTAACKEPAGYTLGIVQGLGVRRVIDGTDAMTGGTFTLVWTRGARNATLISQGAGGGPPFTDEGVRILETEKQVSFLVTYPNAAWLFSLFPEQGLLLIGSQSPGPLGDGAVMKAFKAKCEISE
jgi:hypothetical protein